MAPREAWRVCRGDRLPGGAPAPEKEACLVPGNLDSQCLS